LQLTAAAISSSGGKWLKTVILLKNFSFGFINFVNLPTTFFIQRIFNVIIFFITNRVFNVFYSWGQRFFYIYGNNYIARYGDE